MGAIAIRTKETLFWDGPNRRFTKSEATNELINPAYRDGWSLGQGQHFIKYRTVGQVRESDTGLY